MDNLCGTDLNMVLAEEEVIKLYSHTHVKLKVKSLSYLNTNTIPISIIQCCCFYDIIKINNGLYRVQHRKCLLKCVLRYHVLLYIDCS